MSHIPRFCRVVIPNRQASTPPNAAATRRDFLRFSSAAAGAVVLGFPAIVGGATAPSVFLHGIASGDPLPTGAIIWTRVTPEPAATPGSGQGRAVTVIWEVATDSAFRKVVASGGVKTGPTQDFTVKVDVTRLRASTLYYYRFRLKNSLSPVGRFRTAPGRTTPVNSARFGLVSCANYEGGYFSAYGHLAARTDLDFILHVGDYIYEYETGGYGPGASVGRVHEPTSEIVTLQDYRRRHAQYKTDRQLQALHAGNPFICTWDDHELADDSWRAGAGNHQPETEGSFTTRRSNALRAYFEWMPIRVPSGSTRFYRRFQYGNLVDLSMLDLRQYRDEQPASPLDPAKDDPSRVLLGRDQLDWLQASLATAKAQWKLVGNPVMITPVDFRQPLAPEILEQFGLLTGVPFNVDAWDGYTDDRRELLEYVASRSIQNVAFLTGDIHSSWAADIPLGSASSPSVAVELVGTSITSDNFNDLLGLPERNPTSLEAEAVFQAGNPHVRYLQLDSHGYSVVDVTGARLQMDWYYISDRLNPAAAQRLGASYEVRSGTSKVQPATAPIPARVS